MIADSQQIQITVVIAAYNAGPFIAQTLDSALGQEGVALEVVACDDCSSDDTLGTLRDYASRDPRLKVVANKENLGVSASRNRCFRQAKGQWIAILDADDRFEPSRLRILHAHAVEHRADLIADNLLLDDGGARSLPAWDHGMGEPPARIDLHSLLRSSLPLGGLLSFGYLKPLFHREFLLRHSLDYREDLRLAEDFDLLYRCLEAGAKGMFLPRPLYRYRMTPRSLTRRGGTANLERLMEHNAHLLQRAKRDKNTQVIPLLTKRARQFTQLAHYRRLAKLLKQGRILSAIRVLTEIPSLLFASPLIYFRTRSGRIRKKLRQRSGQCL